MVSLGLVLLVGSSQLCQAAEAYRIITTAELEEWLKADQKPFLVYTLSQVEFDEQRIPGSVCIPTEEMTSTDALPQRMDKALVFYCQGPG
jgi:rhodanese-related sulfurtransferase